VPVSGRVVDERGVALAKRTLSVCAGGCWFGTSGGDGRFTIVPDQHIVLADYALEVHGRPDALSYYTPLPAPASGRITFAAPLPVIALPASGPEILGDGSSQSLGSGDLTVTVGAGTKVLFDVEDYGVPHGHELRVVAVDPQTMPFVDGTPAALYGCAPFETGFDRKVALTFANRAGLPAGAAVEVRAMRGLVNDAPPAGRLEHAANAHVSADGATVQTDPGEGVTELTWLALQKT
jgi:hypothetical protein